MVSFTPRLLPVVGLLALVPVALFALGRADPAVALSLVSVVVVAASLYLMFLPGESEVPPTSRG